MSENKIASAYFREEKFYNLTTFSGRMQIGEERARNLITRLRNAGIIKPVRRKSALDMDELQTEEIISDDSSFLNDENGFVFCFVGIACAENCVLKCLPKYFELDLDEKSFEKNSDNFSHFKKVLKAIRKYKSENSETEDGRAHV